MSSAARITGSGYPVGKRKRVSSGVSRGISIGGGGVAQTDLSTKKRVCSIAFRGIARETFLRNFLPLRAFLTRREINAALDSAESTGIARALFAIKLKIYTVYTVIIILLKRKKLRVKRNSREERKRSTRLFYARRNC